MYLCYTFLEKPTDMIKINKIAKMFNLRVIEDTALSIDQKLK